MDYNECVKEAQAFKRNSKKKCITNIYGMMNTGYVVEDMLINDDAIVFWVNERFRKRLFFVANDLFGLKQLIKSVPQETICEYLYKEKESESVLDFMFQSAGLKPYKVFTRTTEIYGEISPYTVPELGRRKILEDLYDSSFGEYPTLKDAEELYNLNKESFDSHCDDVFTLEEWKTIIKDKRVLIYRENGKIVCYFVWRMDGKKHYSNASLNLGPANYMYNLERRVFEMYWDQGIRTFYWWIARDNKMQKRRGNKNPDRDKTVLTRTYLYNGIYIV